MLAHEVAHILARHTAEKLTSMQAASLARCVRGEEKRENQFSLFDGTRNCRSHLHFSFFQKKKKNSLSLNNSMILYWAFNIPLPLGALELALFLPNSRAAETEADVIGVRLAARACFDPSAAATVFEKLGEVERRASGGGGAGAVPNFMRTHPLSDRRVKRVKQELPAARLLFEKAGCALPRETLRRFVNVLTGEEEGEGVEIEVERGGDDDDPLSRLFK